ncbi:MAG: O-acetyl-ADP-ribose deacetylase [Elusimicrobia bacterium ADurb.Bin231]|nr:MAG: O-acetyl-ADP-ribose deacetylase [Elusimicrobia bacterium ADurb.Bin231]
MASKIELLIADITKIKADGIVNAANTTLLGGGGVDGAIHRAAGPKLLEECLSLHGCKTGEAKITLGYNLPAKYIIHTVGPVWKDGKSKEDFFLAQCYFNSLDIASKYGLKTIAFPSISTGAYRFPTQKAAEIALTEIKKFTENKAIPETVMMILFSQKDFQIYNDAYRRIFNV